MVRAFAHGAMGRRIDPSWWTGVTNPRYVLSWGVFWVFFSSPVDARGVCKRRCFTFR